MAVYASYVKFTTDDSRIDTDNDWVRWMCYHEVNGQRVGVFHLNAPRNYARPIKQRLLNNNNARLQRFSKAKALQFYQDNSGQPSFTEHGERPFQGTDSVGLVQTILDLVHVRKLNKIDFWEHFPSLAMESKYMNLFTQQVVVREEKKARILRQQQISEFNAHGYHPWQSELLSKLETFDERGIYWVYSGDGGVGKSEMAKHQKRLSPNTVGVMTTFDRSRDIALKLNSEWDIIYIDISRDHMRSHQQEPINYGFMESVKGGVVDSDKYVSVIKEMGKVTLVVFANEPPPKNVWSADRYRVFEIVDLRLVAVPFEDLL